ncbi:hypothetical protein [Chryseobacterium indoltheticum]
MMIRHRSYVDKTLKETKCTTQTRNVVLKIINGTVVVRNSGSP